MVRHLVVDVWMVIFAAWQRNGVVVEERFSCATACLVPRERLSSNVQVWVVDVSVQRQQREAWVESINNICKYDAFFMETDASIK